MMKKITSCLLILILTFSFVGCGTNSTKEAAKDKIISLGKNEGNVYKNDFFKMSINIPDKWVVATDEEKNKLIDQSKQLIAGDDKSKSKELDLGQLRTVYLLMTSEKGLQVQSTENPNFIVVAEKLSFFQGVKNGDEYLAEVKKQLKSVGSNMPYNFNKEVYTEEVGKKKFSVLEATIETGNIKMMQKYYACIINGYALSFITTSTSDVGAKSLDGILKSVTFK